jgi:thiamine pyrophosphate-dependent acetolactate synthase large subunit-like protein
VDHSGGVRDAFYDVLRIHGITTIFGNPGLRFKAARA